MLFRSLCAQSLVDDFLAGDADEGALRGEIVQAVRRKHRRGEGLRQLVKDEMLRILEGAGTPPPMTSKPHVILIVGVNGVGKTTTIGKLANQFRQDGKTTLICAADTFRAAAVDQLQIWADRAGVDIVRAKEGSDPAAVVFDAMTASKARGREVVLVDIVHPWHSRWSVRKFGNVRLVTHDVTEVMAEVYRVGSNPSAQIGRAHV